jgi:hypothetical protein
MGRYSMLRVGGRRGEAAAVGRETAEINRHSRRQLGGRTDDLIGFRAANIAFADKKNGVDGEKSGLKPDLCIVSVLRRQRDLDPMSILPCLHSVLTLPGVLSRKQIVLPAVHGADDDAPPERPATAARCAVPGPVPLTGRLRRTCGASGPDRGKPADRQPRRSSARGTLGRRARPGPLSATAIGLTSRAEPALDIAGPGRQASPRCSLARTGAGARGETSTAPTATAREPRPLARVTLQRPTRGGRRSP